MTAPAGAALPPPPDHADPMQRLLAIMARLRAPDGGCPWDLEQTHTTIAPYTIEEAYEVAEAVNQGDPQALKEELGDLLLQVVFQAQIAQDAGGFTFADVAEAISTKMIRRHPHVFAQADGRDSDGQVAAWEVIKAEERAAKGKAESVLDDVALALPALLRALKLQKRAARVGFDWTDPKDVFDKLREELAEFEAEFTAPTRDAARLEEELGDILFCAVNLARHLNVDPEAALRGTNAKFDTRFRFIEAALRAEGRSVEAASLAEMEALWQAAKRAPAL